MSSNLDQLYRQVIMDHYKNPRNKGQLGEDTVTINMNNPTCGDRIQLHLKVEDGKIADAKFDGEGCSISLASASMMTQSVKGLSVEDAIKLAHIFYDMMLGKDYDDTSFDLGISKPFRVFPNFLPESNVQHCLESNGEGRRKRRRDLIKRTGQEQGALPVSL